MVEMTDYKMVVYLVASMEEISVLMLVVEKVFSSVENSVERKVCEVAVWMDV